jgi:hypothetical protein
MGKRSNFPRLAGDRYMTTDHDPVMKLQRHLPRPFAYAEPCAGRGDLIGHHMQFYGHRCVYAGDVRPGRRWIERRDAMSLDRRWRRSSGAEIFVTNPPWTREVLHPLIDHLSSLLPTWILLDASWAHTKQAGPYLDRCQKIVSVGRVVWIEGSDSAGKDDCCWYLFGSQEVGTIFHGLA